MPLHIVTACHGDRRDGCLVGFATQASMKPARMLVCLSTANLTYRIAVSSPRLAVHLVPADRHDLALLFGGETGDDTDKLSDVAWTAGPGGVPLLDDCPRQADRADPVTPPVRRSRGVPARAAG